MTTPLPTDEDREALIRVIEDDANYIFTGSHDEIVADVAADAILAAGFRRSVVSTPSDEVRALIEKARHEAGKWGPGPTATGMLIRQLADALEASAVSAPPTITDEALLAAFERHYLVDDADPFYDRSKLLDGLRAVAALGGEA